jgi:hypothetical protein
MITTLSLCDAAELPLCDAAELPLCDVAELSICDDSAAWSLCDGASIVNWFSCDRGMAGGAARHALITGYPTIVPCATVPKPAGPSPLRREADKGLVFVVGGDLHDHLF